MLKCKHERKIVDPNETHDTNLVQMRVVEVLLVKSMRKNSKIRKILYEAKNKIVILRRNDNEGNYITIIDDTSMNEIELIIHALCMLNELRIVILN